MVRFHRTRPPTVVGMRVDVFEADTPRDLVVVLVAVELRSLEHRLERVGGQVHGELLDLFVCDDIV